jgi:hypothetical protein
MPFTGLQDFKERAVLAFVVSYLSPAGLLARRQVFRPRHVGVPSLLASTRPANYLARRPAIQLFGRLGHGQLVGLPSVAPLFRRW